MKTTTRKLTLSAVFLSIGLVLPLFTMQIKEIGDTLLPMHLPVMLCGILCGSIWGGSVGLILPFLRSAIFGMPPMYPNAVWMAAELAAYGLIIGLVYNRTRKNITGIYISLIAAMLGGRVVWGATKALLLGVAGKSFTFTAFLVGGFADALLGIVLQLILIPLIVKLFNSKKVLTK
ncbi:MAG: ECF transporter S component [Clostridia bacterium]|nr:ECF transporter S component [Clostridia bacterium]